MGNNDDRQIVGSDDARRTAAPDEVRAIAASHALRFLSLLTFLVLVVGLTALLTYSLTASELLRSDSPAFAAWWEAHQFYFMEGGATAFGLLLGIRVAGSFVAGPGRRSWAGLAALMLAIITFAPLLHVCAAAARLGWNAR